MPISSCGAAYPMGVIPSYLHDVALVGFRTCVGRRAGGGGRSGRHSPWHSTRPPTLPRSSPSFQYASPIGFNISIGPPLSKPARSPQVGRQFRPPFSGCSALSLLAPTPHPPRQVAVSFPPVLLIQNTSLNKKASTHFASASHPSPSKGSPT